MATSRPVSIQPALCVLGLCAALVIACATDLEVESREATDFSAWRTWDWAPPHPRDAFGDRELESRLAELIVQHLAERGYERVRGNAPADFFVAYRVSVRHSTMVRSEPAEDEQFHTASSRGPGTFVISRPSGRLLVPYEDAVLSVGLIEPDTGEILWRAERREEVRGEFVAHLEPALDEIFARWPAAQAAPAAD